ncbi:MAG: type II secretion system protein GspG [Deltaproteobacteria bacterium RIFOXYA12_FULL_58_15]|nr:MAG: type II secretion system protein GspG [Deltaproteobacteria bacterium RIFOXYA12_FULL_58_15]OGR07718.1 MAG: type II secretion system protein GspG [Deltaproteobacteria bacterium RIFOXYB12_FULL_58_9]
MTLVEVMVVVVIISMVAGIVGVQVFGRFKDAQRKAAFIQIKDIGKGLELYKLSSRRFPSTAEGLQALTQPVGGAEPVMNSIPNDPWGAPYVYIFPGTQNTTSFDILSYGPDGVQGGGDDVTNWDDPNAPKE